AITGEGGRVTAEPEMHPALLSGKIVEPMRNDHAMGQAGKIVIKRLEGLLAVDLAIPIERSQVCFLFGIHAQDRVASCETLLDEMGQMAKLRIAMRGVTSGEHLQHLAPGKTESIEQTAHDAGAGTDGVFPETLANLLGDQIRPHHR